MPIRKNLSHTQLVRDRIQASAIVERLRGFILAEPERNKLKGPPIEMSSAQVTAALGLLRKVIPDLAAVEHSGHLDVRGAEELSREELIAIARSGRHRAPQPERCEDEPPPVH